jgi:hypothetical protein
MSNANKSIPATPPAPAAVPSPVATSPAVASVKPPIAVVAGDVKVSAGNETPVSLSAVSPAVVSSDESDDKDKIQYFIIVGKIETFPDVSTAEKFLNSPDAPVCTVIYGKVSLVNEWHITTGKIHSFKTLVKAQKFLKESTAPKEFVMVRGRITVPEVRVSLRS